MIPEIVQKSEQLTFYELKQKNEFFQKFMGPILTQAEGYVLGVAAKMFTIAGPVIVFGTASSVVYGVIYWIWTVL